MGPRTFSALPLTTRGARALRKGYSPVPGPGGHLVAWRVGLTATKIYVFDGLGAEFLVSEIQGGAPGPAVGPPSGSGYELGSQVGVPRAFS